MTSGAKRSIAGLAFAIALLPVPGTTAPTPAPDRVAQDMLRACIDAPKTISYIGEVQTTRWGRSGATAMLARIEHEAPNRTRRLYVAPESAYGDYVVTIGSTSYEFDTKRNRIVKT